MIVCVLARPRVCFSTDGDDEFIYLKSACPTSNRTVIDLGLTSNRSFNRQGSPCTHQRANGVDVRITINSSHPHRTWHYPVIQRPLNHRMPSRPARWGVVDTTSKRLSHTSLLCDSIDLACRRENGQLYHTCHVRRVPSAVGTSTYPSAQISVHQMRFLSPQLLITLVQQRCWHHNHQSRCPSLCVFMSPHPQSAEFTSSFSSASSWHPVVSIHVHACGYLCLSIISCCTDDRQICCTWSRVAGYRLIAPLVHSSIDD